MTRLVKAGFFSLIVGVLLAYAQTRRPPVQEFFQTLVANYNPSSLPKLEQVVNITAQISGARPDEISKSLPAIFAAFGHQDDTVKAYAATALFEIARRPDSAALLRSHIGDIGQELLTSPKPEMRAGAMTILGLLQPAPPEVVPIFLNFLRRTDPDSQAQGAGVIFELVQVAPEDPEVIAGIQEFLSRPLDTKARIDTLNALGNPQVKDMRIVSAIISTLDDPDQGVRSTAAQALGRMGQPAVEQAQPALQRLANDPKQPDDVKAAAKEALQKLHHNDNK
jgi:HEAT repeat protein